MKTPIPVTLARRWKTRVALVVRKYETSEKYSDLLKKKYGAVVEITSRTTLRNYVKDVGIKDADIFVCDQDSTNWCLAEKLPAKWCY